MKNIFKILIFAFLVSLTGSCTNEINSTASSNVFISRIDSGVVSPTVLTSATLSDNFTSINWDKSNNGVPSYSTYSIIISDKDADPNFNNSVEYTGNGIVVTDISRNAALTVKEVNELINSLPSFKCGEMNIEIRVKSILGINPSSQYYQYSTPTTYKITGYSLAKPILAFTLSGTNAETAPRILASDFNSFNDYEGYQYLTAGNYQFAKPDACGNFTNATVLGGTAGALSVGGAAINVPTDGFYLIKANLVANTYSVKEFSSVTIYGRATRAGATGFTNNVPLTYNTTSKMWTATLDLINGQTFKFRTIKWPGGALQSPPASAVEPAPDYIPATGLTVTSILGGVTGTNALVENTATGDIKVPGTISGNTSTKYIITVDLNNPRNYSYLLLQQ